MTITHAMIAGDEIDREAAIDREALLYAVQRRMFCDKTGQILDIRTAALVTPVHEETGVHGKAYVIMAHLLDEPHMAGAEIALREAIRTTAERTGYRVEIIDGRDFTARGRLTAKARAQRDAAQAAE